MTNAVIRIGNASPARYLQEARRAVSPEEFAEGVAQIWDKVRASGDVKAFLAVAPYLTGALRREDEGGQQTVIDQFVKVLEQRQRALAAAPEQVVEAEDGAGDGE